MPPRPPKRPRILSDAGKASFTSAPLPLSATPLTSATRGTLDLNQWKFCISTIRSLKKQKDVSPFLHPVDSVALNIPDYPSIVRTPMDLSTVERKLNSSNPTKPDSNPGNSRYLSTEDFIADVRLIFQNCVLFNGDDHPISIMARRLEEIFNKQINNMPLHSLSLKDEDEKADEGPQLRGGPKGPITSSSKRSSKQMKHLSTKKKGGKLRSDNDVLTFEQKKDLSEAVARLDGHQLETVIKIIQEGFPGIDTSTENIELDIDLIPPLVLTKLSNFVLRLVGAPATKGKR